MFHDSLGRPDHASRTRLHRRHISPSLIDREGDQPAEAVRTELTPSKTQENQWVRRAASTQFGTPGWHTASPFVIEFGKRSRPASPATFSPRWSRRSS